MNKGERKGRERGERGERQGETGKEREGGGDGWSKKSGKTRIGRRVE